MWGGRGEGVCKSKWGRGGMGWGGAGGVGDKNKFGLKCFLDDFKCYKVFFLFFLWKIDPSLTPPNKIPLFFFFFFETLPN